MDSKPHQPQSSGDQSRNLHVPGRDEAVRIVRQQVAAAYEQTTSDPTEEAKTDSQSSNGQDWQQYHTAWQQYYQQYYHRYYLQQNYEQRRQSLLDSANQAASPNSGPEIITGDNGTWASPAQQLKQNLLATVGRRARKVQASHHFVPLVSALAVGLLFMFLQYNRLMVADAKAYVSPGSIVNQTDTILVDPTLSSNVGPEPKLIIPKINVNIPVSFDVDSLENQPVQDALTRGVVNYRLPGAASVPGQAGNTVILGHSSNDVFDPGSYKFAFVLLDRLEPGDLFYINYMNKRYIYKVSEKKVINPNQFSVLQIGNSKPTATLVTCTPIGTARQRLLVFADQISPDPARAAATPVSSPANNQPVNIPGNSPTLLDRLLHLFN
jgi:sortase A